ncbi:reverse transcriptase domain-containing protein [Tanacetum coccineum]|uniref:Reverse transcriptase domain-containing protein n=1 Tax=Tanacetum coccineum TaxID=301880 RepID=A0ABQ5H221_9ASTR
MERDEGMRGEVGEVMAEDEMLAGGVLWGGGGHVLAIAIVVQDVKPRVEESSLETLSVDEMISQLRQMCEDAEDRASNAQEEARQKRKEALEECMTPDAQPASLPQDLLNTRTSVVNHAASTSNKRTTRIQPPIIRHATTRIQAVMHETVRVLEEGDRVKFASSTLLDGALTWWNMYVCSVTLDTAHATPWSDFKAMFIWKYCPRNEIKQMENELWNLKVKGTNLTAYNQRFQELILLCPEMVPNADRLLERYIKGLPLNIKGNVTSSKPVDLHEAIEMAQGLMYQVVQELGENSSDKRKWNRNHYPHNPNNTSNLNPNKRPETARVFTAGQGSYAGKLPHYGKCGRHHTDACPPACYNCGKVGHKAKDYRAPPRPATKEDQEAKEDREAMSLVSDVAKKDITRTSCPEQWSFKRWETKFEQHKFLRTIKGKIKETLK